MSALVAAMLAVNAVATERDKERGRSGNDWDFDTQGGMPWPASPTN
jgi:hypothetical protein